MASFIDGHQAVAGGLPRPAHLGVRASQAIADLVGALPAFGIVDQPQVIQMPVVKRRPETDERALSLCPGAVTEDAQAFLTEEPGAENLAVEVLRKGGLFVAGHRVGMVEEPDAIRRRGAGTLHITAGEIAHEPGKPLALGAGAPGIEAFGKGIVGLRELVVG